jgi:hypothetical protein
MHYATISEAGQSSNTIFLSFPAWQERGIFEQICILVKQDSVYMHNLNKSGPIVIDGSHVRSCLYRMHRVITFHFPFGYLQENKICITILHQVCQIFIILLARFQAESKQDITFWASQSQHIEIWIQTNRFKKQSPSWEANSRVSGQGIQVSLPCPHESATAPILSQFNPVHNLTLHFFKIRFNSIIPTTSTSLKWSFYLSFS